MVKFVHFNIHIHHDYQDKLFPSTFFPCTLSTNGLMKAGGNFFFIGGKRNQGGKIMAGNNWQEKIGRNGKVFLAVSFFWWECGTYPF